MLEDHTLLELILGPEEAVEITPKYICTSCGKIMPQVEFYASKERSGQCASCFRIHKSYASLNKKLIRWKAKLDAQAQRDAERADVAEKHGVYASRSEYYLQLQLTARRKALVKLLSQRARTIQIEENRQKRAEARIAAAEHRQEHQEWYNSNPPRTCKVCGEEKRLYDFCKIRGKHKGFTCVVCHNKKKSVAKKARRAALSAERAALDILIPKPAPTAEELRAKRRIQKQRQRANPMHRINRNFSESMRRHFRNMRKNKPLGGWKALVGYSLEELRDHLESLFTEGMSWDNYGEWHIDHIRPKSSFVYISVDDPSFLQCWALSNLQPLWADANCEKGCTYDCKPRV